MDTLAREVIISEAAKVKPGTFTRIGYQTALPVKSQYKKEGVSIKKFVETSARLGVNYHHIAEVIARKAEQQLVEAVKRTNNYEWVLKNKVRHNTSTGKDYLYVANFNRGHNTKSVFVIETEAGVKQLSKEEFMTSKYRHYLIDSYWTSQSMGSEVKNISFENIYRLNSAGVTLEEATR